MVKGKFIYTIRIFKQFTIVANSIFSQIDSSFIVYFVKFSKYIWPKLINSCGFCLHLTLFTFVIGSLILAEVFQDIC